MNLLCNKTEDTSQEIEAAPEKTAKINRKSMGIMPEATIQSEEKQKSHRTETSPETPQEHILNEILSPKKAFKISPHKGVNLTESIKKELKNKNGCRLDSQIHNAYICPIKAKNGVENLLNQNNIKADLIDITDFYPNKDKKINSLENQIEYLIKKISKNEERLLVDVNKHDKQRRPSDFKEPPKIESFSEDESEERKKLRFSFENDFHERLLEIEEDKQKLENLRNSLNIHEKEVRENIFRCGDYIVESTGLYYYPENDDPEGEEPKKTWISSPIWPEAYLRDKEGKSHSLLVKVYDGEKNHIIVLPRTLTDQLPKLKEILLDLGQITPSTPQNLNHLQKFLQKAKPQKMMRCVSKFGWHDDQYIFPDGEVIGKSDDSESVYPLNNERPKGFGQKGSHEDWLNNVWDLCANNSRLIFGVGTSLSAPCMHLIDEDSGGFNYVGPSSIGKTISQAPARSLFGSQDFKRSWKNTSNGFEAICSLHNDLVLIMDEGGQADPKEIGQDIYMFSQGMGKGRMYKDTSSRDSKVWRTMLLSTSEIGLNDLMLEGKKKPKAGQLVRIADIPAAVEGKYGCFEDLHGFENGVDGEEFAKKIKSVCGQYYGTAGREFIKAIIEYGIENAKEDLKNIGDDFAADVARAYDSQVKRVANRFGLVYAALCLAIKLGVLKGRVDGDMAKKSVKDCFLSWLGKRGTTGNMESHSLIEHIEGTLLENSESKFIGKYDVDDKKIRNTIWGYREGSTFYVLPKAFKEICSGSEDAIEILKKKGLLIPGAEKNSQSLRIPAHPNDKGRFYVINLDYKKDDNDE